MNNFDKYFKNRLEGASLKPGAQVWEKIAASGAIGQSTTGLLPLYRKLAVAATLFIAISVVAYLWINEDKSTGIIADESIEDPLKETHLNPVYQPSSPNTETSAKEINGVSDRIDKNETETKPTKGEIRDKTEGKIKSNRKRSSSKEPLIHAKNQPQLAYKSVDMLDPADIKLERNYFQDDSEIIAEHISRIYKYDRSGSPLIVIDPEDLLRLADGGNEQQGNENETLKEKFFQYTEDRIYALADAAGLPIRKLSKVNELEILY